jgi:hypothetical protein
VALFSSKGLLWHLVSLEGSEDSLLVFGVVA